MIVVDASVVVDALVAGTPSVREQIAAASELHAGHHLPVEVMSALRAGERHGRIGGDATHLRAIASLDVRLHPAQPLLSRIWELRSNLTPYDAWYVALAEALRLPLVTLDRRIARAPGVRCDVVVPDV